MSDTLQGLANSEHKLSPILAASGNRSIRVLLVVWFSIGLLKRFNGHSFSFAWTQFLNGVIKCQRDAESRRNDFCRLSCTGECAGCEDIGLNLLGGCQSVAQSLGL